MFKNSTVRTRLTASFGALALMVLIVAGVSLKSLSDADARFVGFVDGINARATLADDVRSAVDRRAIAARNLVLVSRPEDIATEKAAVLQAHEDVKSRLADLTARVVAATPPGDKARALVAEIARVEESYGPVALNIVQLALSGKKDEAALRIDDECRPLLAQLIAATHEYATFTRERQKKITQDAEARNAFQRVILIAACAIAVGAAALCGLLIARSLSRALGAEPDELGQAARRIAEGNLGAIAGAAQAPAGSVLASLGAMQASLARIVSQVRDASESIALGSSEIAAGNADLSQRTEQQASALEETSATMTELGATVRSNADNAAQANQLARLASDVAARGGDVVGQVVSTMRDINDSSRRIAEILSVIDGIAFQTNILALNAAVEAARAGEQGRGFAVVAGEVRSLAQRSAEAAKEIKTLIGDSVARVEQGTQLVDKAGATMTEVVGSIRRVSDIVGEISAASVEQSTGVSQVGDAVTQMDQVTQQNAALVEESAAAAESLKLQAVELVRAVAVFDLGRAPGRSASPTRAARVAAPAPALATPAAAPRAARSTASAPSVRAPAVPPASQTVAGAADDQWQAF
jgi:methyl-accepting chemotaxis protein